ncbi:hypothetical protein B0T24DRAFT_618722 [Lasiosphaeria ovina]|uniref:Secreted protein n=1 Tax=Lasiosphaeria ovina TaxID=92902 RepID=A0AAE0KGP1_9PEZI|nr:hypothetical protein B0T24DRAFT_618722 [Lasiosphaeria ovina]
MSCRWPVAHGGLLILGLPHPLFTAPGATGQAEGWACATLDSVPPAPSRTAPCPPHRPNGLPPPRPTTAARPMFRLL